jgi:hypothetical protein
MISLEPDFEEVFKSTIVCHILRRQVAVVVADRFRLGILIVEGLGGIRLK